MWGGFRVSQEKLTLCLFTSHSKSTPVPWPWEACRLWVAMKPVCCVYQVRLIPAANSLRALRWQGSPATQSPWSILTSQMVQAVKDHAADACYLLLVGFISSHSYFIQRCNTGHWCHCILLPSYGKITPFAAQTFEWARCIIPLNARWKKHPFTYKLDNWVLSSPCRVFLVRNTVLRAS